MVVQVETDDKEFPVAPEMQWVDCPDDCQYGWAYANGQVIRPPVPTKTLPEIIAEFSSGLQEFIESVVAQRQYTSALYCASYVTSTNDQWRAEADTFIAWRDTVWNYCYTELAKFESGERPLIPVDEFLTELPVISWP